MIKRVGYEIERLPGSSLVQVRCDQAFLDVNSDSIYLKRREGDSFNRITVDDFAGLELVANVVVADDNFNYRKHSTFEEAQNFAGSNPVLRLPYVSEGLAILPLLVGKNSHLPVDSIKSSLGFWMQTDTGEKAFLDFGFNPDNFGKPPYIAIGEPEGNLATILIRK